MDTVKLIEGMKKELDGFDKGAEQHKAQAYQAMGVANYLKAKIAELEKAEAEVIPAEEVKDG